MRGFFSALIRLLSAALILSANTACAASFDCAKAGTEVEKMICADPELSRLDEELGAIYSKVRRKSTNSDALKQQQRGWLKKRDTCRDVGCARSLYSERLSALKMLDVQAADQAGDAKSDNWERPEDSQERRLVADAVSKFKHIVLPSLDWAVRASDFFGDPIDELDRAYCESKLNALRDGEGNYFPNPKYKLTAGYRKGKDIKSKWVYEAREGQVLLWFNLTKKHLTYVISPESVNSSAYIPTHSYEEGKVFSQDVALKYTRPDYEPNRSLYPDGPYFYELNTVLIEIDGELFVVEAGALGMTTLPDGVSNREYFARSPLNAVVEMYVNDIWRNEGVLVGSQESEHIRSSGKNFWIGHVLAIHPLNRPWNKFYQNVGISLDDVEWLKANNESSIHACVWGVSEKNVRK